MSGEKILLDGTNMTIELFHKIVNEHQLVEIHPIVTEKLELTRQLVFDLADKGIPIYGFTVGVGWNKDKRVFGKYFEDYNRNLIYAHCVAVQPEASDKSVRAAMLARLCTFLSGHTGAQPALIKRYAEFLNHGIHPIMPERGSVGQGDISCLSHIGLAIIGEGEVMYNGQRMNAGEAHEMAGLSPIVLGPKDGLAIVSSSALSVGKATLLIKEIHDFVRMANIVYALSLEGLNGNLTPLNETVNRLRKMKGQITCADAVRKHLKGSYLETKEITKTLQDALSFRDACSVHGAVLDALDFVTEATITHLNTTEDNPCVILDESRIISCQNYEIPTLTIGLEMVAIALSHLSKASCHRTIKLSNPNFTGLARFLSPSEGEVQAYQTIQKPFTSLDTEIRHLANPTSMDFFAVAGEIEDRANDTPYVVRRVEKILDNLYYILGLEAMHAAQAVDLRGQVEMGLDTRRAYDCFRAFIPFVKEDRPLSPDIQMAYEVLRKKRILQDNCQKIS